MAIPLNLQSYYTKIFRLIIALLYTLPAIMYI